MTNMYVDFVTFVTGPIWTNPAWLLLFLSIFAIILETIFTIAENRMNAKDDAHILDELNPEEILPWVGLITLETLTEYNSILTKRRNALDKQNAVRAADIEWQKTHNGE